MRTVDDAALEFNFAAVKNLVECDQVAELEVELRKTGGHKRGRCPLPDHDSDNPTSFVTTLDADQRYSVWYCFGCSRGGDVIDLYAYMQGLEHNKVWAMEALAERFGIKLMKPEELMTKSQLLVMKAKKKAEQRALDAFLHVFTERAFESWVMPLIATVEDPKRRAELLAECLALAGLGRERTI